MEKLPKLCGKYLTKGSEVLIQGHLQNRSWEAQDGSKRYATDVIVDSFEFCGKKADNGVQNEIQAEVNVVEGNPDDLPF